MKQPVGNYRWLLPVEYESKNWSVYNGDDGDEGWILEVDLDYPEDLHREHSSLPLCPHRCKVTEKMLSPFTLHVLRELRGTDVHESEKLLSTFLPRKNYVVHAANLALYLRLGMTLQKVHRVLQFTHDDFLAKYITFCTQKRKASKSDFRKRMFKAFSNSNFGKFIENSRSHLDCKLIGCPTKMQKLVSNPRYVAFKKLSESGIYAVFLRRKTVKMNQAWAIGFTILDRSKELLYRHYYDILKPSLDNMVAVAMTDTGKQDCATSFL